MVKCEIHLEILFVNKTSLAWEEKKKERKHVTMDQMTNLMKRKEKNSFIKLVLQIIATVSRRAVLKIISCT